MEVSEKLIRNVKPGQMEMPRSLSLTSSWLKKSLEPFWPTVIIFLLALTTCLMRRVMMAWALGVMLPLVDACYTFSRIRSGLLSTTIEGSLPMVVGE